MEKGTLDRRIFTDADIYQEELEKVFGLAWLMVSHESLIPNPNDFFLSYMGEDPVIVTRDSKGEVHVFLNMCRHRGNRVVRADDGNAKNFMCTYHGWTFSNEGKLVSVPGLQEAYYGELDVENLGLVEARVDIYAGIIFACWADDAPTLEAYLGDARYYLDTSFNRRDGGQQAYGPQKWTEPVNWKTPVDNCSDNYHLPVTHLATSLAMGQFGRRSQTAFSTHKALFGSTSKHLHVNGHGLTLRIYEEGQQVQPRFGNGRTPKNNHVFQQFYESIQPELERRLGKFRANRFSLANHTLFPNGVLGFRLALPRGPLKTEFWHFVLVDKDAPDEVRRATIVGYGNNNGITGLMEQDDQDNWIQMTQSGLSPKGRKIPSNLSMGKGRWTNTDPRFPGIVSDGYISENNQRNFYSRWQEFMNAGSWKDIPVAPITANFEGTASMRS